MNATNIPASGPKIELPNTAYILPDNIAMWPPVWWTWLVVGALVILLISLMTIKFISYKRNLYRRDAIKLIDTLEELDDVAFLTQCHQIIRRCLLTLGRNDLASLPSQDLFDQLDLGLAPKYQFKQLGSVFVTGAYQPNLLLKEEQKEEILRLTKHWCRRHRKYA